MASLTSQESPSLDEEMESLKEELARLRKSLAIQCSTILSHPPIQESLRSRARTRSKSKSKNKPKPRSSSSAPAQQSRTKLANLSAQQHAHAQQSQYRIATSVTAFKVRDPDPCAVDGGHVLGLRFESMSRGQFLKPYYVMLNRPFVGSPTALRVHRHTVPPAVPLAGLAARHLPPPRGDGSSLEGGGQGVGRDGQDLEVFVRALRREILRFHNRLGAAADLSARLEGVDVGIADVEAKQVRLTWAGDDRHGRLVMDDDGGIVRAMVFGGEGRDWRTDEMLVGDCRHIDDVVAALDAGGLRDSV